MLLKYNAKVDLECLSNRITGLSVAAQEGYVEILKLLLEHKADINSKNFQCLTLLHSLHISALYGHKECLLILLDKKADINSMTTDGWTVLQMAAAEGFADIVDILLANSIKNVNHGNKSGAAAIYLAREGGHMEVI
ncbi:unnamed protein product [Ceutorhynchus assimilis]|uniref:Uncharacterized protein n=1 Tax=Ceutorhynchus assimilis TaxID=467358 RepID=A0A9N9MV65_9CUCU|nr:unnamed protein product [Ceutorhynchus assimilis]